MGVLYTNNAEAILSSSITNSGTTISVDAGQGALFPATSAGNWYPLTLISESGLDVEIVRVVTRSADTFTVVRAQEGTTGKAFANGAKVQLRLTKALLDQLKLDAYTESFSTQWGGNFILTANSGSTRTIGMASGSNTTLVLQGGAPSGPGANLELTSDLYAYLDAAQTSLRSHDGSTVFLTAKANVVDIPNGNLSVGAFLNQVNWGSAYRSVDVSSSGGFAASSTTVYMGNNTYNNGSGWLAKTPNPGVLYAQTQTAHTWYSMASVQAGTGQTLTTLMSLSSAGALNVIGALTQNGSQVLHAGNWNSFAQPTLVSGTNIKTINGNSLLGSGDITISGSGATSFFLGTTSVAFGRASGTLALSGISLDASSLTSGTVGVARLGSGTANTGTFLRGDGSWASIPGALSGVTDANASASGYNGITALGYGTVSGNPNTYQSVVIGYEAEIRTSAQRSIAIGYRARTNGYAYYAIAIGSNAISGGERTIAIGNSSGSTGTGNITIGGSATASYQTGIIVIGDGAYGNTQNSIAIGRSAYLSARSIGIGSYVNDNGYESIILAKNESFSAPSSGFFVDAVTEETADKVLYFNTSTKKISYGAAAGGALSSLTGVQISNPTAGQVLKFNGTVWTNAADETGGSGEEEQPTMVEMTTRIEPNNQTYRSNNYQMYLGIADSAAQTHVYNTIVAAANAVAGVGSLNVRIVYNSTMYIVQNIDGNASNYIANNPGMIIFNNYNVVMTSAGTVANSITLTFQGNIMQPVNTSPTQFSFQPNGSMQGIHQLFQTHRPFAAYIHPGNYQNAFGTVGPATSPGTPTVTATNFQSNPVTVTGTFQTLPYTGDYSPMLTLVLGMTSMVAQSSGGGGGGASLTLEASGENLYFPGSYGSFSAGPVVANSKSLFFLYPMGYSGTINSQSGWPGNMNYTPGMYMSTDVAPTTPAQFYVQYPGLNVLAVKTHTVGSLSTHNNFFSLGLSVNPGSSNLVSPPKSEYSMFSGGASQFGTVYITVVYTSGHPNASVYDTLAPDAPLVATTYTKSGQVDLGGAMMKYKIFAFPVSSLPSGGSIPLLTMTGSASMNDQIPMYVTY